MQISKYDYQLFTLMKPAVFTWCLIHVLRKASLKRGNTSKTNITADLCNCSVCSTQVTAGNPDPDFFQKFLYASPKRLSRSSFNQRFLLFHLCLHFFHLKWFFENAGKDILKSAVIPPRTAFVLHIRYFSSDILSH